MNCDNRVIVSFSKSMVSFSKSTITCKCKRKLKMRTLAKTEDGFAYGFFYCKKCKLEFIGLENGELRIKRL